MVSASTTVPSATNSAPSKSRRQRVGRAQEHFVGQTRLQHAAAFEHQQFVGEQRGFHRVMRDQNGRCVELVLQRQHLLAQRRPKRRIERRKRFVKQQQAGRADQRSRQRDALLLAERQRVRAAAVRGREARAARSRPWPAGSAPSRKRELLGDCQMGKQTVVLRHIGDAARRGFERGDILAIEHDAAAIAGLDAGDHLQRQRFA